MPAPLVHDIPSQRVVLAPGAAARIGEEAAHLGVSRALVIATPAHVVEQARQAVIYKAP